MSLCCPLCSSAVPWEGLEGHLRYELRLPLLACLLCPHTFSDDAAAEAHFRGPSARHPGHAASVMRCPEEAEKAAQLEELLRLARGGPGVIDQRLCVCGRCQLLCREDIGTTAASDTLQAEQTKRQSPDDYRPAFGVVETPASLEPPWLGAVEEGDTDLKDAVESQQAQGLFDVEGNTQNREEAARHIANPAEDSQAALLRPLTEESESEAGREAKAVAREGSLPSRSEGASETKGLRKLKRPATATDGTLSEEAKGSRDRAFVVPFVAQQNSGGDRRWFAALKHPVWRFFAVRRDERGDWSICQVPGCALGPDGGPYEGRNKYTTNLVNHVRKRHRDAVPELEEAMKGWVAPNKPKSRRQGVIFQE